MEKLKKHSYPGTQIGISLLLVVFIILCLTTFATLSLSASLRDNEYSKKAAKQASDYYQACSQAQETLCEIDLLLQDASHNTHTQVEYFEYIGKHLSVYPNSSMHMDHTHNAISFTEVMNQNQFLEVMIELTYEKPAASHPYKIIKWKTAPSKNWEDKTTLPVLRSNNKETD